MSSISEQKVKRFMPGHWHKILLRLHINCAIVDLCFLLQCILAYSRLGHLAFRCRAVFFFAKIPSTDRRPTKRYGIFGGEDIIGEKAERMREKRSHASNSMSTRVNRTRSSYNSTANLLPPIQNFTLIGGHSILFSSLSLN